MNNKKILVVGILAVIVTMMVGYALFSETITINGTATAKGDFDITATCQAGLPSDSAYNSSKTYFEGKGYIEGGYDNDSCTVNGNTVTMKTNLKYPGAARYFTVTFKNTGSIPISFSLDHTNATKECKDEDGDNVAETCNNNAGFGFSMFYEGNDYAIKTDGTIIDAQDESADLSEFLDENDRAVLQPNQSVVSTYMFVWNKNKDTDEYNGKLFTTEETLTYEFTQITN